MAQLKDGVAVDTDKLLAFRQGLHLMDTGLRMDGPLKKQLEALESRDARAVQELAALQTRKDSVRGTMPLILYCRFSLFLFFAFAADA